MTNEHVYEIAPSVGNKRLMRSVFGRDRNCLKQHTGVEERLLPIGDYPEFLAIGYLPNQGMLFADDEITGVAAPMPLVNVEPKRNHRT